MVTIELDLTGMTESFARYAADHFGCELVSFTGGAARFTCPSREHANALVTSLYAPGLDELEVKVIEHLIDEGRPLN